MKTDLTKILSISGQSGLFNYISQARNGAIVESLSDGKRSCFGMNSRITTLADISIYTDEGETKLKEVFLKMKEVLGDADALGNGRAAVDERGRQFGGIDVSAAHFQKVRLSVFERAFHKFVDVVDAPHGSDGEVAQMRAHEQGLGFVVRNAADAEFSLHFRKIAFEFGAERGVFDAVNGAVEAVFSVYGHASAPCSEV